MQDCSSMEWSRTNRATWENWSDVYALKFGVHLKEKHIISPTESLRSSLFYISSDGPKSHVLGKNYKDKDYEIFAKHCKVFWKINLHMIMYTYIHTLWLYTKSPLKLTLMVNFGTIPWDIGWDMDVMEDHWLSVLSRLLVLCMQSVFTLPFFSFWAWSQGVGLLEAFCLAADPKGGPPPGPP